MIGDTTSEEFGAITLLVPLVGSLYSAHNNGKLSAIIVRSRLIVAPQCEGGFMQYTKAILSGLITSTITNPPDNHVTPQEP